MRNQKSVSVLLSTSVLVLSLCMPVFEASAVKDASVKKGTQEIEESSEMFDAQEVSPCSPNSSKKRKCEDNSSLDVAVIQSPKEQKVEHSLHNEVKNDVSAVDKIIQKYFKNEKGSFWKILQLFPPSSAELEILETAVKDEDVDLQLDLAHMYHYGRCVTKDYGKALEWYTRAANLGCVESSVALAEYFLSKGDEKSVAKWSMVGFRSVYDSGYYSLMNSLSVSFKWNRDATFQDRHPEFLISNASILERHLLQSMSYPASCIIDYDPQSPFRNNGGNKMFFDKYTQAFNVFKKFTVVLNRFKDIAPEVFLINAVKASDEIKKPGDPFFSVDIIDDVEYLTLWDDQCAIVREFLDLFNKPLIGEAQKSVMQEAEESIGFLKTRMESCFLEIKDEPCLFEGPVKGKFTQSQWQEYTMKILQVKEDFGVKISPSAFHFLRHYEALEDLTNAKGYLEGVVKFGLGGRNAEFKKEFGNLE